MLSEEAVGKIREEVARYPDPRSALMHALWIAQHEHEGWLPREAIAEVAELMGLTEADVQSVASFYSMYYKRPVGRYLIDVCHNVSCALLGGRHLLRHILDALGVAEGEMTPDGLFTVKGAECLAGCGGAPCVQVNAIFYENVTPEKADALIEQLRNEGGPLQWGPAPEFIEVN